MLTNSQLVHQTTSPVYQGVSQLCLVWWCTVRLVGFVESLMLPHVMKSGVLEELVGAAALSLQAVQGSHAKAHHTSCDVTDWRLQCWHGGVGCYGGTSYLHCPHVGSRCTMWLNYNSRCPFVASRIRSHSDFISRL